jgi:hypothetical protein
MKYMLMHVLKKKANHHERQTEIVVNSVGLHRLSLDKELVITSWGE